MVEGIIRGTILRWGNTYGVRLAARTVRELGLTPGEEVNLHILGPPSKIDLSDMPVGRSGHANTSTDHDAVLADHLERRKLRRRPAGSR